jgi:hypothetical protein
MLYLEVCNLGEKYHLVHFVRLGGRGASDPYFPLFFCQPTVITGVSFVNHRHADTLQPRALIG